jgi:hypothetical protein
LAAPLLEATRADYENRLRVKDEALAEQQDELKRKEFAAGELAQQLEKREADLNRKSENDRAEIDAQRKQLAAEVARQGFQEQAGIVRNWIRQRSGSRFHQRDHAIKAPPRRTSPRHTAWFILTEPVSAHSYLEELSAVSRDSSHSESRAGALVSAP